MEGGVGRCLPFYLGFRGLIQEGERKSEVLLSGGLVEDFGK